MAGAVADGRSQRPERSWSCPMSRRSRTEEAVEEGHSVPKNTMMEPSNLDHHHQEELHESSYLAPAAPSFHGLGANHEWSQSLVLNCGDFISNASGVLSSQRDYRQSHEIPPSLNSEVVQDLGFHWGGSAESFMHHSAHQLNVNLAKIKEDLADSFPKLSGVIRDPSTIEAYQLEEKLLRTLASDCQINGCQPRSTNLFNAQSLVSYGSGSGNLSTVFPTANISNPCAPLQAFPGSSAGMDLQALDLLASARYGRSFCQPLLSGMGLLRENTAFGFGHAHHEPAQGPSHSHHKVRACSSFFYHKDPVENTR